MDNVWEDCDLLYYVRNGLSTKRLVLGSDHRDILVSALHLVYHPIKIAVGGLGEHITG